MVADRAVKSSIMIGWSSCVVGGDKIFQKVFVFSRAHSFFSLSLFPALFL